MSRKWKMAPSRIVSRATLKARGIVKELNLVNPDDIYIEEIAMHYGVFVRSQTLKNYQGRLVRSRNCGIITLNSQIRETGKIRFVIAHELGHFELENKRKVVFNCTESDFQMWKKKQRATELAANEFAAELLMPEEIFKVNRKQMPFGFTAIKTLSTDFKTSLTATGIRYVQLSDEICALVYAEDRLIRWFFPSPDFHHFIPVKYYLSEDTFAFNFFNKMKLPNEFSSVRADAWFSGNDINPKAQIKEHTIPFPNYNATLTLLWVEEEI
jgi:Zn-dependent peptidase ImmA (M78 family)